MTMTAVRVVVLPAKIVTVMTSASIPPMKDLVHAGWL
jgi:hypothetical protein